MSWRRELAKLGAMFRRARPVDDLAEEIRLHLEKEERENLESGMPPEEAHYAALRRFGNVTLAEERSREMWTWRSIETLAQDLRYGLRQLRRSPGFTAVAVITLALGIGANTAIFSLIDALMLRSLSVEKPAQLVQPLRRGFGGTWSRFSYPDFEQFRDHSDVLSGITALSWLSETLLDARLDGQPENISGQLVSGNFFSLLGVHPAVGHLIGPDDDHVGRGTTVAVVSYAYWKQHFNGSTSALGARIVLHRAPFTIIGVVPANFAGVTPGYLPDVYIPFATEPIFHDQETWLDKDQYHWVQMIARLQPSVTIEQAHAQLEVLYTQMLHAGVQSEWSSSDRERFLAQKLELTPAAGGLSDLRRELGKPVFLLAGMVALVLLIACANVASMLLARAVTRHREFAVRLALGAGRARVIRQLLTESALLGLGGGVIGLMLASWLSNLLDLLVSLGQGHAHVVLHPSFRLLAFTTAVSFLTTVLFGLTPAWRATQVEVAPALKENRRAAGWGGRRGRLGKSLVVSQVALCIVLLFGAGLFVQTLRKLETLDPGFNRNNVLLFSIDPAAEGYKGNEIAGSYRRVLERLNSVPGVRSASISGSTPISGSGWRLEVSVEDYAAKPNEDVVVNLNSVGPQFFETLQTPLLLGRDFGAQDSEKSPKSAIVNRAMASYFFGERNPIGKKIRWNAYGGLKKEYEIIGVVGDAKYLDMREQPPRTVYVDCFQDALGEMNFEVRTNIKPEAMLTEIRKAVESLGGGVRVSNFKTLDEQVNESLGQEQLIASLSCLFGGLALLLAGVGLYGIMAYAVSQRTNDIGIRMALGAARSAVLWMVLREALILVCLGIAIGVPAAFAATRLITSFLFELTPTDAATISAATSVMLVAAALAAYLPARRATKIDPMVALRHE